MSLELRSDYWHDAESKKAFMDYIQQIFHLDFRPWHDAGYWDECYVPFSYFEDGKIVSSMCFYSLTMTVNGSARKVAQISGVGTIPSKRNQGLNKELTEIALKRLAQGHDFVFLFASKAGIPYYKKTGFLPTHEHRVSIEAPLITGSPDWTKFSSTDTASLEKIFKLACDRVPVSDVLGIAHPKLLMYHVLYTLKDCIYYIQALDCIVFLTRKDGCVTIFDIVCRKNLPFRDIYPFIAAAGDRTIEFRFMTDKLDLSECKVDTYPDNSVFVRGNFPFQSGTFLFPLTAQA